MDTTTVRIICALLAVGLLLVIVLKRRKQGTISRPTWSDTYWPKKDSTDAARRAARQAAGLCFLVAGITALLAVLSEFGIKILDLDIWALVDATFFLLVGIGIRKMWRSAAMVGLLLYLLGVVNSVLNGRPPNIVTIIFILGFVSGIRATFAYRRLLEQERAASLGMGGSLER